jgi:hypothetical protein
MKKIPYVAFFILGVLIAEIPFLHLIEYLMVSMVQPIYTSILDIITFVLGFIIGFKALNDLGKLKHKKIIL